MFNKGDKIGCNLTLEILRGCDYMCSDCTVDKGHLPIDVSEEDTRDLLALIDDFDNGLYTKLEYTIGPTDMVSADNGLASLEHPLIVGLSERFNNTVFPLAMLTDNGLLELCKRVDETLAGKNFVINVPATIKNLRNAKYLEMLSKRIDLIKSNVHKAIFYRVNLNINIMQDNVEKFTAEENVYMTSIQFSVHTAIEYGFGHSRKGLSNILTVEELKHDIKSFSTDAQGLVDSVHNIFLVPRAYEAVEMVYRDGKLYYLPILFERFPMFLDMFEIPKPWTADKVHEFKETVSEQNLLHFAKSPVCGDCCFLAKCVRGDVLTVARILNNDECMIDMKNRYSIDPHSYRRPTDHDQG